MTKKHDVGILNRRGICDDFDASVILFSILETAKLNGQNPGAWFNHVLSVLPDCFAQNPETAIDDLSRGLMTCTGSLDWSAVD